MANASIRYQCGCGWWTKDQRTAELHADEKGHKVEVSGTIFSDNPHVKPSKLRQDKMNSKNRKSHAPHVLVPASVSVSVPKTPATPTTPASTYNPDTFASLRAKLTKKKEQ